MNLGGAGGSSSGSTNTSGTIGSNSAGPGSTSSSGNPDEDDISLNNRKMVLNFGDKGEEDDSNNDHFK
jgi:hypothetical protein